MKPLHLTVKALPEDPRLDKVIPFYFKEISRTAARKLIENGSVYINNKRCHQNAKEIHSGDNIRLMMATPPLAKEEESENPISSEQIIFENQDIIVVNKPPFLPSHETIDNSRYHLVLAVQEFLAARDKKKPSDIYLGIHHRLDRDTSGAILFTKRKEANAAVAQAFQNQEVHKTYMALCIGKPTKPNFTVKNFLGPSAKNKRFFCSVTRGGKFAETEVTILDSKQIGPKTLNLVEAKPKTGRTHQIRVHLSENKLPIIGDTAYGIAFEGAARVMLHARQLEILGKVFHAPLPDDFLSFGLDVK